MGAVRMVRTSSLSIRLFPIFGLELQQRHLVAEFYLFARFMHMHDLVDDLEKRGLAIDVDVVRLVCRAPTAIEKNLRRRHARHRRIVLAGHNAGERPDRGLGMRARKRAHIERHVLLTFWSSHLRSSSSP